MAVPAENTITPKRHRNRILGTVLALLILAALVWGVDKTELLRALASVTLGNFCFLLLISGLLIYISALKWKLFLESLGATVNVGRLCVLYLVGYFVNLIVPSIVGGDAVRSLYVRGGISAHDALAATILERYTGLVAMVGLGLIAMWWVPGVTFGARVAVFLVAIGVVVGTIAALSPRLKTFVSHVPFGAVLNKHLSKIQGGLQLAAQNYKLLFYSFLLSLLYHCSTVLNTVVAGFAVGWNDAPILELFVVLPLALLIGAIPVTPGGLGVQEGALVFFLMQAGATEAQALGIGLVLRAKTYVLALLGGIGWLSVRHDCTSLSAKH